MKRLLLACACSVGLVGAVVLPSRAETVTPIGGNGLTVIAYAEPNGATRATLPMGAGDASPERILPVRVAGANQLAFDGAPDATYTEPDGDMAVTVTLVDADGNQSQDIAHTQTNATLALTGRLGSFAQAHGTLI